MCVCVCVCVYYIFTHSSIDGHLFCFPILAIVNNAVVKIEVCIYIYVCVCIYIYIYIYIFKLVFSYSLDNYPEVE